MKKILILICIILFCNSGILSQDNKKTDKTVMEIFQRLDSIKRCAIGKDFCEFESVTLNGEVISKKDLIGKITFVDLWFATCSTCIAEMGNLIELYDNLKDDKNFQFLSFTVDAFETANKAVEKYNIPFIVCPVSHEEAYRMNFNTGFPTKIIIDKEGKIVFFQNSGSKDQGVKEIEDIIKQLL